MRRPQRPCNFVAWTSHWSFEPLGLVPHGLPRVQILKAALGFPSAALESRASRLLWGYRRLQSRLHCEQASHISVFGESMGCAGQDSRHSVGQSRIGRIGHGHESKDAVGSWWRGEASRDSVQDRHRSAGRNSLARLGVCASLFLAGADALLAPSVNSVARPVVQSLQRLRGGWGSVSWECESLGQLRPVPNVDLERCATPCHVLTSDSTFLTSLLLRQLHGNMA
jgi:hypothetical protein